MNSYYVLKVNIFYLNNFFENKVNTSQNNDDSLSLRTKDSESAPDC